MEAERCTPQNETMSRSRRLLPYNIGIQACDSLARRSRRRRRGLLCWRANRARFWRLPLALERGLAAAARTHHCRDLPQYSSLLLEAIVPVPLRQPDFALAADEHQEVELQNGGGGA